MCASSSPATRAWASSASACTQAIDEPGMMSWNCSVSTSRHSSSKAPGAPPAVAVQSSASRSSRSQRLLPSLVRSWLVNVPRWVSKYSSPRHTGTGAPARTSASTWVKKSSGDPSSTRGIPSRSTDPPEAFEHLPGRSAAAVAVPERHQRPLAPGVLGEAPHRVRQLLGLDLGVVGVDRREVGQHPRPVEALPPERGVREPVLAVPRQLLGDEPLHAAGGEDLGQPGGVAEHVGDPHLATAHAEVLLEEALPEHDLADDALAGRQVHVGLDPHPAGRDPLAGADLLGDPGEQLRLPLPDPLVLLGLRAGEPVLRRIVHQGDGRCERAHALAHGLGQRPQPRRVDVGMADRHHPVGAVARRHARGPAPRPPGPHPPRHQPDRAGRGPPRWPPGSAPAADRRSATCASSRRARRGRGGGPRPRCRRTPARRAADGRARPARRSAASRAGTAGTAGASGSTPPRRRARRDLARS